MKACNWCGGESFRVFYRADVSLEECNTCGVQRTGLIGASARVQGIDVPPPVSPDTQSRGSYTSKRKRRQANKGVT